MERTESTVRATDGGTVGAGSGDYSRCGGEGAVAGQERNAAH